MAGFEGCAFSLEAPGNSHDAQAAGLAQQRLWQCAQVDQQYGWPSTQQNVYQADYSHRLGVGLRPPHDTESTYGDSQNGPVKFYHGVEFGLDRYGNWFPLQSQAGQEPYNPNGPYPTREMIRRYSTYVGSTVIDRRYYVNEFLNPQEPAVSIPTLKENVPMDFADQTLYPVNAPEAQIYGRSRDAIVKILAQGANGAAVGTGFFVNGSGELATDLHVIGGKNLIQVQTATGRQYAARVEGIDVSNDLAVLKVDSVSDYFPALPLGSSSQYPGEGALTLGHPQGVERIFASPGRFAGTITYAGDARVQQELLSKGQNPNRPFLAYDMHTEAGDSGGPVLNSLGQVMGIQDRSNGINRATCTPVENLEALLTQIHSGQSTQSFYYGQPFGS